MVLGRVLDVLAQLRLPSVPTEVVRRDLIPPTSTILSEGDPGQQGRLVGPRDQIVHARDLKKLPKKEGRDIGVRLNPDADSRGRSGSPPPSCKVLGIEMC
jgi:hypothetical protein